MPLAPLPAETKPHVQDAPGDMHVFERLNADDVTDVVSLLISHGVAQLDAKRFVTSVTKANNNSEPATFFELYGQGGLSRAAKRHRDMNVQGLEVLDLRTQRPDGEY